MIPRLKPYFDFKEIKAACSFKPLSVENFESEFARKFGNKYGLTFLYGRSGLYALLKCLGITNSEIIIPAYTCVVAAHAIVASGNIPRFVDINPNDYNMNLDLVEQSINKKTKAIIGTALFGYPYDVKRLKNIIENSGKNILLIQDCAHSFGAEFEGELISGQGDASIFSFGISKQIASVRGGAITTNNEEIYKKLKNYRNDYFRNSSFIDELKTLHYFLSTYIVFWEPVYTIVNFFERKTSLLNSLVKYYDENKINMPKNFMENMPKISIRLGITQLEKYDKIKRKRIENAAYYYEKLKNIAGITLPVPINGATYSHFVIKVENREKTLKAMRKRGVQLGQIIEYAIPYMKAYGRYKTGEFPVSLDCSKRLVNLPVYPSLSKKQREYIANSFMTVLMRRNN